MLLYPMVGFISIAAYMPQIVKLLLAKADCANMALSSWLIWLVTAAITLAYAVYGVADLIFSAVSFVNFALIAVTSALIVYNRYIRFRAAHRGAVKS